MLSAVIPAAGLSTRMENKNKLLLPYHGKTVLEATLHNILAAGITDVVVVTGRDAELVRAAIQHLPVRMVHNPHFAAGLTGSIQKGVQEATGDGYMICLADMVLIMPDEYRLLAQQFARRQAVDAKCICLPVYGGRRGNPVVFAAAWREAIMTHEQAEGCKAIVQGHAANVYEVEMTSDHVLQDMDYPEDYLRVAES